MNKLSDLIGYWQPDQKVIDTIMQNEQQSEGMLLLSQEEKDSLLQKILEKANISEQTIELTSESKKFRLKKRLLPAILVAIFAMATLSFAAVNTIIDPVFLTYLKPAYQEQIDALQNSAVLLGQEDSDNGYTVRARQAIGDKNTVYVLFDLIAEDEKVLDLPYYGFSSYDVTLKNSHTPFHFDIGGMGMGYSIAEMDDENPTDNMRTFLLELSSDQSLLKKELDIRFENICTYHETEPYEETLISGKWQLSIPLDYKDASITTHPMKKIPFYKSSARVTSLRISPISVTIAATGIGVSQYDSTPEAQTNNPESQAIEITLKDGSKVDFHSSGTHSDGITFSKDQSFSKIIDLREIKSIRYMNVEFWD